MKFKHLASKYVLPAINLLANLVSLKVVTLGTPNRDFRQFFKHLSSLGIEFKSVIDVGVAFGSPALYESISRAKFYLVEPVPECKILLDKLAKNLDATTFNLAAGSYDGEMDFFVHPDISGSSSFQQVEGVFFDGKKHKIPVRRLDSIIPLPLLRPSLLKIDTQGAELDVLTGATKLIEQIDVIIIEVSFHEFRIDAPEFDEVVIRMTELGYKCYEVLEGHYRSVDNALAQVDLVFVKNDSVLRQVKSFFTNSQAKNYLNK